MNEIRYYRNYFPNFNTFKCQILNDKQTSEPFPIEKGVRQGDPISQKLFTAAIEEVFQRSILQSGIEIEVENRTDFHFADDVALCTKDKETF